MLDQSFTYIEFGAGKGRLSHEVGERLEGKAKILLLERESRRQKFDTFHKSESFKRVKIDIAHFDLDKLPNLFDSEKKPDPSIPKEESKTDLYKIMAIAKHLCGGATDICLTAMTRDIKNVVPYGVLLAPCCHHSCDLKTYVNLEYMTDKLGLNFKEIMEIFAATMWANSGCINKKINEEMKELGITSQERTIAGFMSKRIINIGRLLYMKSHGFTKVILKRYCDLKYSPENLLIICSK